MLRDGELVYAAEREAGTRWLASGCRAMGLAYVLLGQPQEAITALREGLALLRDHPDWPHFLVVNLGYLAFAAADLGDGRNLQRWAIEASQVVAGERLEETAGGAIASTAAALAREQRGDHTDAARELEKARQRRRYLPGVPWLEADLALRCAHVSLGLGDAPGAAECVQLADDALQGYPDAGALPARLARTEARIKQGEAYGLSSAELRVLVFLPTHLSLQEIADRLFLSRSTVKTHVASIYDKLGVPARSEAVEIVEQLGLGAT
jgi:LuxR family maltose regulon positive regulatory protein